MNGAVLGDDNWLLFSLEEDETDWDTVVQVRFGNNKTSTEDDAILAVWHDDALSNENVLAGVSSFSEISAVP